MRGISGKDIRPQHQHANSGFNLCRARQIGQIGCDARGKIGVVKAAIGVINRGFRKSAAPVFAVGIAAQKEADHLFDVVVRPAQPILHRQEPGAQVLRLAGDEPQNLWQAAQHRHLLFAGICTCLGRRFQLFQQRHRPRSGLGHIQIAHFRQLDDLAVGNHANECVNPGTGGG